MTSVNSTNGQDFQSGNISRGQADIINARLPEIDQESDEMMAVERSREKLNAKSDHGPEDIERFFLWSTEEPCGLAVETARHDVVAAVDTEY